MAVKVVRQIAGQYLLKRYKPHITKYIKNEFGSIAGGAAGIGLSFAVGDYAGGFYDAWNYFKGGKPDKGNPPFGYLDNTGTSLNGSTNGSFHKTLRSNNFQYGYNRRNRGRNSGRKCYCNARKPRYRG